MGINKLNTLFENATQYQGKFKTIIIDGTNLIVTQLSAIKSMLLKDHIYSPWATINMNIIEQFYKILNDTTNSLITRLQSLKSLLTSDGEILFITDSSEEPKYITIDNRVLYMKSIEREKRKQSQDRSGKISEQIERIKLEYGVYVNDECINENEIKDLFNQMDFYNNPKHYLMLTDLIIKMLIGKVHSTTFIKAISEADFVIKNLAASYNEQPVLVMSRDSDYYVLLSDLKNVYKTDISIGKAIHYPNQIWNEILGFNITQKQLSYVVTLIGNDYVGHEQLLSMTDDTDKNINKIKGLLNISGGFKTEILKSRMKKIKSLITIDPNDVTTNNEFDSIINNIEDPNLRDQYKNSIIIYDSWMLNFDFVILDTNEDEIEELMRRKMEYILKYCGVIYNWNPSQIESCIKNKFKNKSEIVDTLEDTPSDVPEVNFEIINDIYEFYEEICEEYLEGMM